MAENWWLLFDRLKMCYISLFVQLLMLNASEKPLKACGSLANGLNKELLRLPCRNLMHKA